MSKIYNGEIKCIKDFYSTGITTSRKLNIKGEKYRYSDNYNVSTTWPFRIQTEIGVDYHVSVKSFVKYFEEVPKFIDFGIDCEDWEI